MLAAAHAVIHSLVSFIPMKSLNHSPLQLKPLHTAAVLLAAGSASRMGGQPKCLLQLDGASLIERQISALRAAGITDIVVVLGHYAAAIEAALHHLPIRIVHNPHPDAGQATSLRIGLTAVAQGEPTAFDAYYIGLADQPLIGQSEIADLLAAHQQRPAGCEFTQPRVEGLPGNPVVFTPQVRQDLLQATGEWGGRQWQQAHADQVYPWATANPHYRIDLDSPEDLQAFTLRTGRALHWPASALR
jgi:CTP:molybdopterin cytidylyltransferase MocA